MTLKEARSLLKLPEEASLNEIRNAYRRLAKKYHPDRCPDSDKRKCEERIKKINKAYETVLGFCAEYKFPLCDSETPKQKKRKEYREHLKRFYDGWWFDLDEK
ncbi:MAG: DnaJ domain-containing protein [Elusimicrobia bacterium]|nr:DnaJ domain-containing protein [Elusimicrobiota bacterium]